MDLVYAGLFCVLWASAFAAAKIALHDCPPLTLLAIRFFLAGGIMIGVAALTGGIPRLTGTDLAKLALIGLLNNALYLGFAWSGVRLVHSGFAAILGSTNPIFVAMLAALVLGERLTPAKLAGLALGIAGVVIVMRSRLGGGEDPVGALLVMIGVAALVSGTVLFKKLAPGGGLWLGTATQFLVSGVAILPVALVFEDPRAIDPTPELLWSLAYIVIGCTIAAYFLWMRLLSRTSATAASSLFFLMPPLGLFFGWLALGEPVAAGDLIGIVPIAIGIRLVTRG